MFSKKILMGIILFLVILFGAWVAFGYFAIRNIEEPQYTVLEVKEGYEIREYSAYIVAETKVSGELRKRMNSGFMVVADYIFGNNTTKESIAMTAPVTSSDENSEKIAMTAPVISEESSNSESIAMTAPVLTDEETGDETLSFVMPSKYTLETLPKPNNDAVTLREVPARKVAVLRFSGRFISKNTEEKKLELLAALERDGLKAGKISYAGYNPPFTPPFMTRNEVWVEIVK